MIKIAIQKAGRLNEDSLDILKKCGISIDNGKDQLKAVARNYPLEVLYLRNGCLLYTSPSPRDRQKSRMPSSA